MTKECPKRMLKEEFLKRVMDSKLSSNQALTQLTEQLHAYEKRYNLRSEVFYWLIVGTPAEDQPGFIA